MGVHGLWELLAPVGRRVSVETLAGKKLAIDASIWMVQFMKAMRDEKGDMVRNAHILGFFRRICKLLFLRTKPVFVFDGATPALKRRTVIARRRQRENAQAKIRKTAEKLLLNHLKATRLKELANDLENQRQKNDAKGKKVIIDQEELAGNNAEGNNTLSFSCNQEALDEILAASLAAEADDSCTGNASTSGVEIPFEEEDDDEEMIFPLMTGKVDPSVLAALPPSMQLDLLVQMRERLMAENRQKYQKVKKVPAKFSELQIQAYLKTVAFRREIDEVQKSAAGKGVGGVQSTRIASEANREFIFSTSFTGDKQIITSAGVERHGEKQGQSQTQLQPPTSEPAESVASTKKSHPETVSVSDDTGRVFDDEIETYLDERGHVRVSRVRAMGIRMTRDLQRNLDLMKEIEHDIVSTKDIVNSNSVLGKNAGGISINLTDKIQLKKASYQFIDGSVHLDDRNDQSTPKNSNSMEISFEDDGGHECLDVDDDIFADLVAGDPVMNSKDDVSTLKNHSCDSDSNFDWEEGLIEEKGDSLLLDVEKETRLPFAEGHNNDESEVEWEDGDCVVFKNVSTSLAGPSKNASKGSLEEDADFQEAIRRSLEDIMKQKSSDASLEDGKLREVRKMSHEITRIQENDRLLPNLPQENALQLDKQSYEVVSGVGRSDGEAGMDMLGTGDSPEEHLATSKVVNTDCVEGLLDKPFETYPKFHDEHFWRDTIKGGDLRGQIGNVKSIPPVGEKGVHLVMEEFKSNAGGQISTSATQSVVTTEIFDMVLGETPHVIAADAPVNVLEAAAHNLVVGPSQEGDSFVKELTIKHDVVQKLSQENIAELKGDEEFTLKDDIVKPMDFTEASLEDEITNLGRERVDLADEQRKLERNAESVSSEMFAECQELLQMFGLPYIIAPMEAEAQCAYLELSNLVDGVVTDDSDVFLFGSQNVYKNIFDNRKYVETYFMKDIENDLGLTREQLIHMALLLGSDYTEGVSGIGIVNAIEVVNAFPEEDGLTKFREWIESPDPTILGMFDAQKGSSSGNRGTKVGENNANCSNINMEGLDEIVPQSNTKQLFMDKHRNVSKNWHIPSTFPNVAVISAYVCPQVDKSTEPFSWGKPDLFVLRKLCWEKFGWNIHKADELLLPVLKEYNKHETQLRLEAFYSFNERFAKIRSKRIKKAVKGITGNTSISENRNDKSTENVSRKRKNKEPEPYGGRKLEPFMQTEGGGKITKKSLSARGRGGGSENNSDDGCSSSYEKEKQEEKLGRPRELRKSTRTRKPVKYTSDDDSELDEPGKASQDQQNCASEKVTVKESSEDHGLVGDTLSARGESRSVEEHSGGAYFEKGGGFCLDELKTGVVESCKEYYLNTGGGFCLNEDDGTKEDNFECGFEAANFMEEDNAERLNTDELYNKQSNDTISLSSRESIRKADSVTLPVKSLTAMPHLRRKRRKN